MTQNARDERGLGELFADLARDTGTLLRQEVQLAKTELADSANRVRSNSTLIIGGTGFLHAGVLAIVAAIIMALGSFIALWLAALIVGLVVLAAGYALVEKGITAIKRVEPAPQTIQTLKEDKKWVEQQTR